MDFLGWTASIGFLLLLMSLASGWIRHLPITTFSLYLAAGIVAGPWCLKWLNINYSAHALDIARVTEMALVVSLFMTGLKLRMRWSDPAWRIALRLALPAMMLTVAGVCVAVHWIFTLPWPLALLIGAILSPTDPVLASMVAVDGATDHDRLRVALSGEAGLNDGTGLPFVLLALLMLGGSVSVGSVGHWLGADFAWPLIGGLGIGFMLGWGIGWVGVCMKTASADVARSDFLALALMALSYATATTVLASGFLAAFAAGLGLRHVELYVAKRHSRSEPADGDLAIANTPPAEALVNPHVRSAEEARQPLASMGMVMSDALSFGDTLERLIAAALVFLLGVEFADYWQPQAVVAVLILFVVVRPLAIWLCTIGSHMPTSRRLLIGWVGIRGFGSLNYLAYAATHGLDPSQTTLVAKFVVTTVVLSIILHGITTPPLMAWRQARMHAQTQSSAANNTMTP
ncbi:sodium:proton antiporter [Rhodanobacter sp. AS-Z3]|uniref:cation:proton antiporter n=1 Tax=Rhodanobacter sp. AS-Z3 TaxID=3031330 RepID=UPI00247AC1A5|nr:sodium:proton antiporter [Rhodanobacter sp. AS-Z3]WEN14866.1 sodium:proton antiporter [Rhodanobacter sp. AS-Z3]